MDRTLIIKDIVNGTDDKCRAEAGVEPVSMPGVDALTDRAVSSWHGSL